ncbi:hypothetical protein PCANC_00910 [Puccinia coronata f. sp. avenae]|uniref:Hydrophobin n=1 Tax=Puccinia coronata f. sp. avenae TaxID=200324 RepID=A0A2N5SFS2_9BASI|nr:hypothetical protein PCANC_19508 [Puccinia coronata f. sp. avenae]PLW21009.1 hypothetical protein PCASD_15106 [Puccinia coronata f. sp. avenae]PLW58258.1 hypothetical protein PCANC_00910 [Puccinia coronata f. sp. avenae]
MRFVFYLSPMCGILVLIMTSFYHVFGAFCPSNALSKAVCGATLGDGSMKEAQGPGEIINQAQDFLCKDTKFNTPMCCKNEFGKVNGVFDKTSCGGAPQGAKKPFTKRKISKNG